MGIGSTVPDCSNQFTYWYCWKFSIHCILDIYIVSTVDTGRIEMNIENLITELLQVGFTEEEVIVIHDWINKQIGPMIDKIGSN